LIRVNLLFYFSTSNSKKIGNLWSPRDKLKKEKIAKSRF